MRRVIAACALLGTAVLAVLAPTISATASASVPYNDPAQTGYLTFCDAHGHRVTGGSLGAAPFVAKVISGVAAQAPYNAPGASAFVDAYQPRQGVTPAEWTGEELISASIFSNDAHPAVVGTKGDISLGQFVNDAPPHWDGFVQLRMFVKPPDGEYDALHYAAADLQVSGNQWHVVRGGNLSCGAGNARSLAALLAPSAAAGKLNTPPPVAHVSRPTGAATGSRGTSGPATGSADDATTSAAGNASGHSSSSSSFPTGYVVLGAIIAVLAAALLYTYRRKAT